MNRTIEKIWLFTVAFCLMATLSAFVAVSASHQNAEETLSELVELQENAALTSRRERRSLRKDQHFTSRPSSELLRVKMTFNARIASFIPVSERANLNGTGVNLRI